MQKKNSSRVPGNAERTVIRFLTILKINLCSAIAFQLCLMLRAGWLNQYLGRRAKWVVELVFLKPKFVHLK